MPRSFALDCPPPAVGSSSRPINSLAFISITVKALVTGANGFLGSHLVDLLIRQGWTVRAMVRQPGFQPAAGAVELANGDIRDPDAVALACSGMDVVFHTAGISGIWGEWKQFHAVNTVGTRNVVAACQRHQVPKLVYTSSPSVTFTGEHQINVDESVPYARRWLCHYPHSKALAEQHVLASNDPPQLMTCALRPHLIWGPRDRHLIPRLIQRAKARQLRRVGDGRNRIDHIFVENAAWAHLDAARALQPGSAACGRAYFLSQDDPTNCWEWINEILALAGLPAVRRSISFPAAWRIGWCLELYHEAFSIAREPRMTRFLAAQLAKSHYFDISRAKNDLGYRVRVSTGEGMARLAGSIG
jgi:nucleoside-diphosphate-sugar epimerase